MADYETRTIVYVTHPDGSPNLWLEVAADGTRTLVDDGKAPVVLALGEDVDEAVAQWRVAVGDDEAERDPITTTSSERDHRREPLGRCRPHARLHAPPLIQVLSRYRRRWLCDTCETRAAECSCD